jgi:HlyD family secretion protein
VERKFISLLILAVLAGGGLYAYQKIAGGAAETRYILSTVRTGTVVSTVSASGQVTTDSQLELKPKVSAEVIYIGVSEGQKIPAGKLLLQLDSTNAQKSVRDARTNLESARIALQKLNKPVEQLPLLQAENALSDAEDDLSKTYKDSLTHVSNAFLDFPNLVEGLNDMITGGDANPSQWNIDFYENATTPYDSKASTYRKAAYDSYKEAKASYDKTFAFYQSIGVSADEATTKQALDSAYATSKLLLAAVKNMNTFIQFYSDVMDTQDIIPNAAATEALQTLSSNILTINTHLSTLNADIVAIRSLTQSVAEKTASLADVRAGVDVLDIQTAELNVTKAQNALTDAENLLADYYMRAPFSGTVASMNVRKYDVVSTATAVATLITGEKLAELSLNEVDAAKVDLGDSAELTFDALENITLSGKVVEIDTIGTVSQGVVSYSVKIAFGSDDARIKPGMTVNADIQTGMAADVLVVPSSAIKSQNGRQFVQVFDPPLEVPRPQNFATSTPRQGLAQAQSGVATSQLPKIVFVTVGLSNDTMSEIVEGVLEGQQIVVRTTNAAQTTQQAPSLFGTPGGRTGGVRQR